MGMLFGSNLIQPTAGGIASNGWNVPSGNGWGGVISTGLGILGDYFTAKQQTKTAKALAKAQMSGVDYRQQPVGVQSMAPPIGTSPLLMPYQTAGFSLGLGGPEGITLSTTPSGPPTAVVPVQPPGMPMAPTGGGMPVVSAPGLFRTAATGARAVSRFVTQNPQSGNLTWYRTMGRPVLWSSDVQTCRRVKRVAGKAYRAAGGGSASRKKRR